MNKSLVIIPTFNERDNIGSLIPQILEQGPEFEVLVIDDNSPDGTAEIVSQLVAENKRVNLIQRSGKLGLGTAYLEGFRYGLRKGYDYIFEMDADFSHQPKYLPALLEAAKQTGISVGSRSIAGGGVENWPWYRKAISRGGSMYARTVLGLKVHDCTGGFKCFSSRILQVLNPAEQIQSTGFGFQVELNCLAEWNGFEIREVPIIFPDRVMGKSKMNKKIFLEALLLVWKLRLGQKSRIQTALAGTPYVRPIKEAALATEDAVPQWRRK